VVLSEQIVPGSFAFALSYLLDHELGLSALDAQDTKKGTKDERGRQVARFFPRPADLSHPSVRMRQAIDSPRGRQLHSQRIGTVEPVFANLRHHKRLSRLNHRGEAKDRAQWSLYCMVHNIEKLQKAGFG